MKASLAFGSNSVVVDLSSPVGLAIALDFAGAQPRHFGAPRAEARSFAVPGFSGSVATGASCNCSVITLTPHCNGTHTECVGHLTVEPLDAHRTVPAGLVPALLVSVTAIDSSLTDESSVPPPLPGDLLITRRALEESWPRSLPFAPRALIVRTLPNDAGKISRDYTNSTPPYLSRAAAELMVARAIEHLVIDLPSIDRAHDEGRLSSHRVFFGLPPDSRSLAEARRPRATITEFAFVPDEISDGACLLEIQVPAIGGDAVPSRPLLYRLEVQ